MKQGPSHTYLFEKINLRKTQCRVQINMLIHTHTRTQKAVGQL